MPVLEIIVNHAQGLHARPAALFVKTATYYPCEVLVSNLTTNSVGVNAKSILNVLTLGVNSGSLIKIETRGEEAEEALRVLQELILSDFRE